MVSGIYIRTDEARKNMSEAQKNRAPFSKKTKEKMSKSHKGKIFSNETKQKMSLARTGEHCSESTKEKISKSNSGINHWMFGKNIDMSGENSPAWKGGISKIDKLCRAMSDYKQWRTSVFIRDNWTCVSCGINKCYVTAHHIKSFSKIINDNGITNIINARKCDEMWDINNGITLCENCHAKTDNYRGRAKLKGDKCV